MVSRHPGRPAAEATNVVEVRGLAKRYQRTTALQNVSLEVQRGEIFGLIGPDGSGKSSLIRAIAGVQQYDSGRIAVFGNVIDSERSAERVKGRIGLMPQGLGNHLYAQLSIDENLDYFAGLRLVPSKLLQRRKDRLLQITRLIDFRDRPMAQLSGGMKQKLGLVCTLIHEPDFVLLDEPTTGVDPVSRRDFWSILTELVHESEMTAIVSTAYMDEAAYMDRLALFMEGRIVTQGTEEDLRSLAVGTLVSFPSPNALAMVDKIRPRYRQVQSLGSEVRVFVPCRDADCRLDSLAHLADVPRSALSTSSPDLEDVLAYLLTKDSRPNPSSHLSITDRHSLGPRESSAGAPIQARDLVRDFGRFRAVAGVSFEVAGGRIFGLLGSNGAGKTTVIKMLTGLLPPTSGSASVAGAVLRRSSRAFRGRASQVISGRASQAIRERIGYMSQSFSLYSDMTAQENLEFYAGVYGLFPKQRRERIKELVGMIGLEGHERRLTADLPIGLRQRLALGCALVHRPRVVFLDEPTSGVDVVGRRQFWEILVRLAREEGVAILVTTHYMIEAEHCDDLALMYAGRVVASGPPSDLRGDLQQRAGRSLGLITSSPLQALRVARANGFDRAALLGRSLRVLSRDPEADQGRLRDLFSAHRIKVVDVEHEPVTMEDVFVDSILSQEQAGETRACARLRRSETAGKST